MSWLSHLAHLGVRECDEGACIVWKCPRCGVPRDYHLIESRGNFSIIGIEFSRPAILLDLRCSECGYEVRVDPSEKPMLDETIKMTRLLKAGSISIGAYQESIRRLPTRFVGALKALNEVWRCSGCREENPVSFDSCWNCRSPKGTPSTCVVDSEEPLPGLGRGGNPWETM